MTLTLSDLTYMVARVMGGGILKEGTATGGTTTTIVDTLRDEEDDYWNDGTIWILKDAAGAGALPEGQYSIVTDFDNATNTLTIQAITEVAAGDVYAVCKRRFPLYVLIQAVNNALVEIGAVPRNDTTLTTEDDKTEYELPSSAINRDLRQVFMQRRDDDSDDNRWIEIVNWYPKKGATGSVDTLVMRAQPSAGYSLMLVYMDDHADLVDYDDELNENIHPSRISYHAAAWCMAWYRDKTRLRDFDTLIDDLELRAERAANKYPIRMPAKTPGHLLTYGVL